jgi:hypothetical protein
MDYRSGCYGYGVVVVECDDRFCTKCCDLEDTDFYDMLDVIKDRRVLIWQKPFLLEDNLNQCVFSLLL